MSRRAALLEGRENDGVLPPVEELPPGATAAAVAGQQVTLLRHSIRSAVLGSFVRVALEHVDSPADDEP